MGYFGSEGIYDSNLSFWGKKFKKKILDPTQLLQNAPYLDILWIHRYIT